MQTFFSEVIVFITNTLSLRRSCWVWQCSKDLQSHNAIWVAPFCRRSLRLLCIPRLLDGQGWFRQGLPLALRLLRYHWFDHLVRYRSNISQVLQGTESTGHRQEEAPVRAQSTAIRGMVVCVWDRVRPLRACLSFSPVATVVTDDHLPSSTHGTAVMNHSSSALGTCSSKVGGRPARS